MHAYLYVDEIVRLITRELVVPEATVTAVALTCCCKSFEDLVLDRPKADCSLCSSLCRETFGTKADEP